MAASTKPTSRPADTSGWLTANQAIDLLGCARSTLASWERSGHLHPQVAQRGTSCRLVRVYDPDELARMPRRSKPVLPSDAGELHARVFELFYEGKTINDVVILAREPASKIIELHELWLDGGGADLVIGRAAQVELERHVGTFRTVAELVERVVARLGMPLTGSSIAEAIERGQREQIEIDASPELEHATDEQIERAIVCALDAAEDRAP